MTPTCIHCYVAGHVQGICFRHETKKQAMSCGVTGWVRNIPDGRVEVLACGASDQIEDFLVWLKQGPTGSQVVDVVVEQQEWQDISSFSIEV